MSGINVTDWVEDDIAKLSKLMNVRRLGQTFGSNILYRCTNKNPKDKGVLFLLSSTAFQKLEYINVYDGSKVVKYSSSSESHFSLQDNKHNVESMANAIFSCFVFGFNEDRSYSFYKNNITIASPGEFFMDDVVGYITKTGDIKLELPNLDGALVGKIQTYPMHNVLKANWKLE